MEEKKFELGPLQKFWIESLRKHPERQLVSWLGEGNPRKYKACCLGELHICAHRLAKKKLPFLGDDIADIRLNDNSHSTRLLSSSYEKYGLRSGYGAFRTSTNLKGIECTSLAWMNDNGFTWPEIADYIEANPENVFTKSV